jgi:hypothetical protein
MKVKSMRGQDVDMAALAARDSHKVALGNAGLNARGDKVSKNGRVITTREQIMMNDYNTTNPKAVRQMGLSDIRSEVLSAGEAAGKVRDTQKQHSRRRIVD